MTRLYLDGPALYGALPVSTTPVEIKVGASPLTERQAVTLQPLDGDIYYGFDSSVSTSNGTKVFSGQLYFIGLGDNLQVFVVTASGTVDVRISEIG